MNLSLYNLIYLIPALPFAGFLILSLAGRRMPRSIAASIGVGSVGLSALLALALGYSFITSPPPGQAYHQTLWIWMQVGNFAPAVSFSLDALSLLMIFVITFVGFLIHVYSIEYMRDDEGFSRFFAYLNLFVSSMLVLVLADNLLLLYLGWEGVGLCSYLLIGFWYRDPANGRAARKAFIVTRLGDTAMAIGLFLLFTNLGTLNIQELLRLAPEHWPVNAPLAVAAAALLLGGALGKSAQLPLQVWLPDAMAGPTPVSALIHAATMVTAGVYLIARTHAIFTLAPIVLHAVAIIGAATLLIAGCSALVQKDIKRVLAYSTISQIGYMFLALGVGAWTAAMFHFMTHAFFKALLFLGAGVIINAQHHEQDLFKMGGLKDKLPMTFWTFLAGAASLSALPLVTAGFYSKDLILWQVWTSPWGNVWLTFIGLAGALITSTYAFRMVFLAFFGKQKMPVTKQPGPSMLVPLTVLAVFAIIAGFVQTPHTLGSVNQFADLLGRALPQLAASEGRAIDELILQIVGAAACLGGILLAYYLYLRRPEKAESLAGTPAGKALQRFWFSGWGFDWLYNAILIAPFLAITRVLRRDALDDIFAGIVNLNQWLHRRLSMTQTGSIRWYAAGIAFGVVVLLGFVIIFH